MAAGAIAGSGQVFAACDQRLIGLSRLSGRLCVRLFRQCNEASEKGGGTFHRRHHGLQGETINAAIAVTSSPRTNIGLDRMAT